MKRIGKWIKGNLVMFLTLGLAVTIAVGSYGYQEMRRQQEQVAREDLLVRLEEAQNALEELKSVDQIKRNDELEKTINNIETTYKDLSKTYELVTDLREAGTKVSELEKKLASAMNMLANRKFEDASKTLDEIEKEIVSIKQRQEEARVAEVAKVQQQTIENVASIATPPDSGYRRQVVESPAGRFTVSVVAADIASTRVIVDTASGGTCSNDCPVMSLGEYAARNGAFAGVNGTYFCPATYPSCAGKTNSFDLLVMNKDKVYFNSDNNVYSNNPGVIFGGGYVRFVTAVSQWGRDTGIDGMLSNYPLLVFNGSITFSEPGDVKMSSRGNRSFVASQGGKVYIGVVHNAAVSESAIVLKAMGMENALNLDDGGSTALWSGGYKVGPGRGLPNVILFTRR